MRITKQAIQKVKNIIKIECGKLPKKHQDACRKAAIGVGEGLRKQLSKCNRLKGEKKRACHKGRMVTIRAIALAK